MAASELGPRLRRWLAPAIVLALAGGARAQPAGPAASLADEGPAAASPDDERAAREAFERGNQALRDAYFVEAAKAYRDALSHWDHPCIRYNLALALVNLDDPVAVVEALEGATDAAGAGATGATGACVEGAARLARLARGLVADVEVTLEHPGARLIVDDQPVFVGPGTWRGRLPAGRHTLRGEAPGMATAMYAQALPGGETTRIDLKLYTEIIEDFGVRRPMPRWVPYTIIGVGLEVAIAGGLLHASSSQLADDYEQQRAACAPGDVACPLDPDLLALRDASHSRRGAAFGLYAAGAGLAAVGVAMLWYERTRRHGPPSAAALVPVGGGDVTGLAAVGHF